MLKGCKVALAISLACSTMLSGCNSDSDETATTEVQHYTIEGFGVKGPLALATVTTYRLDNTQDDFKGTVIASGSTDESAKIVGLTIPTNQATPFILEIESNDDTTDITNGDAPLIKTLRTIITAKMLVGEIPVYVTPLTTLATDLAIKNADNIDVYGGNGNGTVSSSELLAAIDISAQQITSTFGFGIDEAIDIYTSPAVITNNTSTIEQLSQVVQHRVAIEAISAIIVNLQEQSVQNNAENNVTTDEILSALVEDLSDGAIDGSVSDEAIKVMADITDLSASFSIEPSLLMVPGTDISVTDIKQVLISEVAKTGSTTDTTALTDGSISVDILPANIFVDIDGDTISDTIDNCINIANTEQLDTDRDLQGDICDDDDDGDGVIDEEDEFPLDFIEYVDTDKDGLGNTVDPDDDNDGVLDINDAFPLDDQESLDTDLDGIGNNTDDDDDGDGVLDIDDGLPLDETETIDTDLDGIGNNSDDDDDGDGVSDDNDDFPLDKFESVDTDQNGMGNNLDPDDDGDGILDRVDNCPLNANSDQLDTNDDGLGDVCQIGKFGQATWNSGSEFQ